MKLALSVGVVCLTAFNAVGLTSARSLFGGSANSKKTVVFFSDQAEKSAFGSFLGELESRGHKLTFASTRDSVSLEQYGEWSFDNLVFLASDLDKTAQTFKKLPAFLEAGGNVMMALPKVSSYPKASVTFLEKIGVDVHPAGSQVVDHFSNFDGNSTVIKTTNYCKIPYVVGELSRTSPSIAYDGVSFDVQKENYLAVSVLRGDSTSYSADAKKKEAKPYSAGSKTLLVTAIQARNNARLVLTGSAAMCSDALLSKGEGNKALCSALSKWAFQEAGVIQASNIEHHRADGSAPDPMLKAVQREDLPFSLYPDPEIARESLTYRIKDELIYAFNLSEYKEGKWVPYKANDVQLEFVMLDPYVRTTMKHNQKGRFEAKFTAPDAYGIYQFRVMYRRPGLSVLHFTTQVSLRPFKHDEYERFITAATPYYTSVFSLMAGFLLLSMMFLFGK